MSTLHLQDCIEGVSQLGSDSIHLTVTSPPYNLTTAYKNPIHYNSYTDDKEYNHYISWLTDVFSYVYDKTTDDGRLVINIGDQKNGAVPTHTFLQQSLISIGWHPMATIIWNKRQTRNRAAWGSYLSPSSPSFPSPFEYLLVFYKNSKKLQRQGETDLTAEEFKQFAYGIWDIAPETQRQKHFNHPALFPSEIPRRFIKMLTYKGDRVLDPFAGIGTTLITADALFRESIGFEIDEEYYSQYSSLKKLLGTQHRTS